jgi:hypothetical protein
MAIEMNEVEAMLTDLHALLKGLALEAEQRRISTFDLEKRVYFLGQQEAYDLAAARLNEIRTKTSQARHALTYTIEPMRYPLGDEERFEILAWNADGKLVWSAINYHSVEAAEDALESMHDAGARYPRVGGG